MNILHDPSWIEKYLNAPMHTVMSHHGDAETNYFLEAEIYSCLADCVNQIKVKSIILVWGRVTPGVCV